MRMKRAIPALPVKDMKRSVAFYQEQLGFRLGHQEDGFAVLHRDEVEVHLWAASDESWRTRAASAPVVSGAESFIAGTASCRIQVDGVDELYETYQRLGIIHPNGALADQ